MSGLEDMPENCVALVLMHMDPPEICKLAGVNRLFRDAASADFVWESKLPSNYQFLIDKALEFEEKDKAMMNLRKKDVYSRLCKRNPLNGVSKVLLSVLFLYLESLNFGLWTVDWFRVLNWWRSFGSTRELEACQWRFLGRHWRLLELVIGDIGIISQLMNLGEMI